MNWDFGLSPKIFLVLAVGLIVAGLVVCDQRDARAGEVTPTPGYKVLEPIRHGNLTVFPVVAAKSYPTGEFLTLDEGLALKQVSVNESKTGGAVNTLYVTNESKKPLYLVGGEVVLGSQQDRTLGRDTIIAPGQREVPVTVFCVEHGRWTGRSEFDQSAPTIASAEIRASAQEGEFFAARAAAGPGVPPGAARATTTIRNTA